MPRIDSEQFYLRALEKYGTSAKGVNWTSQETQNIRFKILFNFLPKDIYSLVDAGCGFADLYAYMQKEDILPKKYTGIDSIATMCTIAKENTKQNILHRDITQDLLPKSEYYVCSGAMNILNPYETHLFIRNCFQASTKGFIFNILCGNKQSTTYNYLTKERIHAIAQSLSVTRIQLEEGYLDNDITVGFFHV